MVYSGVTPRGNSFLTSAQAGSRDDFQVPSLPGEYIPDQFTLSSFKNIIKPPPGLQDAEQTLEQIIQSFDVPVASNDAPLQDFDIQEDMQPIVSNDKEGKVLETKQEQKFDPEVTEPKLEPLKPVQSTKRTPKNKIERIVLVRDGAMGGKPYFDFRRL